MNLMGKKNFLLGPQLGIMNNIYFKETPMRYEQIEQSELSCGPLSTLCPLTSSKAPLC